MIATICKEVRDFCKEIINTLYELKNKPLKRERVKCSAEQMQTARRIDRPAAEFFCRELPYERAQ